MANRRVRPARPAKVAEGDGDHHFHLRMDRKLSRAVATIARDENRSFNAQVEDFVQDAVQRYRAAKAAEAASAAG